MKLRRRLGIEWASVALFASLMISALVYWAPLSGFDNLFYDRLSDLDRPKAAEDILIVAVDEDSLANFGKWPWKRDVHARLFEQMAKANPKVIAFDILLSEAGDEIEDQQLASAMAKNDNLFLPVHFVFPGSDGAAFDTKQPISIFKEPSSGLGHVNLVFDRDGVVRKFQPCFENRVTKTIWPHLMEQVYRRINGKRSQASQNIESCSEAWLLPFAQRGSFATISYAAVAKGEVPAGFLNDKIILIGATANGLGDQHPVPLGDGGTMAGVEIMANMLSGLRNDNFIKPLPFWQQLAISLLPLWILLIGFWRWRPRSSLLVSLGLYLAVLSTSAMLLTLNIWFAPSAALAGLALIYPVWGWRRLQATSEFMDEELQTFRSSNIDIPVGVSAAGPVDVVTGQAEELTHAIAHMRDLRRFISDALSNLPDPMFITDLEGKVIFANKLAQTGLEDGAQNMALDAMLDRFVALEDLADVKDYLTLQIQPTEHDYVDFTSRNDEVFAMRRAPVVSDEGELRGYIHYLADITEVANASQEREEVLELLSHDMRAPQAAILALLDDQPPTDTHRRIEGHARRTLALADNFVGLARIKASEFDGEDLLLSELVIEANDSLWPLANAREIKCRVDDQSDGAFIVGEPSSLHRSFVNLIDNAIKYSPDETTIDIQLRNISIDNQSFVSVSIADQGEGIAEELLGHLFERFTTDDKGAKGAVKGSGLGLNFVETVIQRHGGSIRAENIRDGGARFTILLPVAPELETGGEN